MARDDALDVFDADPFRLAGAVDMSQDLVDALTLFGLLDRDEVGRVAVLNDPQGATFGIIKPQPQSS